MILEQSTAAGIAVYRLGPDLTPAQVKDLAGTYATTADYDLLLTSDSDVYDEAGDVLLKFRKSRIPAATLDDAVDAVKAYVGAFTPSLRAAFKGKGVRTRTLGVYDRWGHSHHKMFREMQVAPPSAARATRFVNEYPKRWARTLPIVHAVDAMYRELHPEKHASQLATVNDTGWRIDGTAFTTVSVNASRSTYHTDAGNLVDSFGNLTVGATGEYTGSHLVMPRWRVAVDCRPGDFLLMDTLRLHGNTAIEQAGQGAMRLSIVCYVRKGIVDKTSGSTLEEARDAQQAFKALSAQYAALQGYKR